MPNSPTGSAKAAQPPKGTDDPRYLAAVDLLGHTGAHEFQIRYCDEDTPLVWMALGRWNRHWAVGAALGPLAAIFDLCDNVIDGGHCTHCQRPTGFAPDLDPMPLAPLVCWYQWDPSTRKFVRSCAGDHP